MVGALVALLTLMKGQPLAYNKDNQEDKEPLFDAADTLCNSLHAFAELVPGIGVHADTMRRAAARGHANATDLADYLVRKGVAFRDAHEAVGRAVRLASQRGCALEELGLSELQAFCPQIDAGAIDAIQLESCVAARNHEGGTAPAQVQAQVPAWRRRLGG